MKPEQFIREFGEKKARGVVEAAIDGSTHVIYKQADGLINLRDLRYLLESVDLVNSLGGLKAARLEAHKDCFVYNQPLLAAIAAYESIYGCGGDE
ncbi:hypothetical protein [Acinetobacter baumannii]|uniref:hypothetical protein n=1 Tax=Acinetobacter baumannii TaxID=470 RepID=UPI00145BA01C|nr:hypothetical protein [Acinetobacter baumannii]EKT7957583.1 hypothetical protein [Acinetobacter baumannii]MBC6791489.1 hypothetical protein [Acinetobacter baumannii]MBV6571528.1 hypothetical protein [Acinetobacter baumannii]MBV6575956.1 hypothetical protein [Acinetobacter baumannii]QJF39935.1 hypothetical protein HIN88_12990 [Acinetobacter baumannii]